jgi:glyoxalase family protein
VKLRGIHHITAIATDPQRNLDFYTGVLGLRLVKRTVNFDDPSTYHFYFGDRTGRPGTAITFFPWPQARRGTHGVGQITTISFAIAEPAIDFWKSRLQEHHVVSEKSRSRFGDAVLCFTDPDGLLLELITSQPLDDVDLAYDSDVPPQFAIHGFHVPTLEVQRAEKTEQLLDALGFELLAEEKMRRRFSLNAKSISAAMDLIEHRNGSFGVNSAGTVHHIAFRCADEAEQLNWRKRILDLDLHVTPVIDRQYFHSIYFREPGGILFEIATEGPGFATDEAVEHLGEGLKLPPQYEPDRAEIERVLPPISIGRALKLTMRHPSK